MVKLCYGKYNTTNSNNDITEYTEKYPFDLSDFQKWSILATLTGNHSLVLSHTGSGKTLCGTFGIDYFILNQGKKMVYTTPLKAISNQKYHDITKEYPNVSVGIRTGDICINENADIVIMTAECLLNKLYDMGKRNDDNNSMKTTQINEISFDFNINDISCIVMDEIHYINDEDRGKIWEETIMLLPSHIQLIMLSATISNPEKLALWIENVMGGENKNGDKKEVYITGTDKRVVPLTHYAFLTTNQRIYKMINDKETEKFIRSNTNVPIMIKDEVGNFIEENLIKSQKIKTIIDKNKIHIHLSHSLNQITKHLVSENLLPAICFIYSRKTIELCCEEITTNLLEFDSKTPYIVRRECEQILRSKLLNYTEYLHLPVYLKLVGLMEKGIAIHHSSVPPILRELVEICFSKGYIKLLLATETFAVGINMPVKSVIFSDLNKFDGKTTRMLMPFEYSQQSGRAGRRGIDKHGYVFHLTNLCRNIQIQDYKLIMSQKTQTLTSKFKITYQLVLNLINHYQNQFQTIIDMTTITLNEYILNYVKKSMIQEDVYFNTNRIQEELNKKQIEIENIETLIKTANINFEEINEYINLEQELNNKQQITISNKLRKEIIKRIQQIENLDGKQINKTHIQVVKSLNSKKIEYKIMKEQLDTNTSFYEKEITTIINILKTIDYITDTDNDNNNITIKTTPYGMIASKLREIDCIVFSKFIYLEHLNSLNSKELVGLLSCFCDIRVSNDEKRAIVPCSMNKKIEKFIVSICESVELHKKIEQDFGYFPNNNNNEETLCFDFIDYFMDWCDCVDANDCQVILNRIETEKEVMIGDIIKGFIKIKNIAFEMERVCELYGNMELLYNLRQIPSLILKYLITTQSLYL